jgi:hypothetical protein
MPVDVNDVLNLLSQLSDDAKLRVTVKESVKGGVICGVACAIGGVVGGPVGLAVGEYRDLPTCPTNQKSMCGTGTVSQKP